MIKFFKELKITLDYAIYNRKADAKGMKRMARRIKVLKKEVDLRDKQISVLQGMYALQGRKLALLEKKDIFPTLSLANKQEAVTH